MDIQRLVFRSFCPAVCCIFLGSILIFIYSITFLIYTLGSSTEESTLALQSLSINLNSPPIQDLQITEKDCPAGYTAKKLGEWPGIRSGCQVDDKIQDACDSVEFTVGGSKFSYEIGTIIYAIEPLPFYFWNGRKFCVKYNTNYKWDSICTGNHRRCSPGLCVLKNESCPITEIQIIKNSPASIDNNTEYLLPFAYSQFLKVSRKSETPIIDLRTSYNGLPCYEIGKQHSGPIAPYPLLKTEFTCGIYGEDTNSYFIEKRGEFELYVMNGLKTIVSQIPGYLSTIGDRQMYFSYIKKIEVNTKNPNCVSNNDHLVITGTPDYYLTRTLVYGVLLIIFLAFEFVVFMMSMFSFSVHLCKPTEDDIIKSLFQYIGSIVSLIQFVFLAITWIGAWALSKEIRETDNGFDYLRHAGCIYDDSYIWAIDNYDVFLSGLADTMASDISIVGCIFFARVFVGSIFLIWDDRQALIRRYLPFIDHQDPA